MDIRKLQRTIVDGLEDVKGQNIVVFNTEHLSPLFERVIIASGTSNRQTKALAASVRDAVKSRGFGVMRTEGEDNGEWIIVDCGAAVVHLMQPSIRDYYHLEEIWGEKPVKMKLDDQPTRLVKASEEPAPAKKPAAKKPAAGKAPASRAPAARPAAAKGSFAKAPAAKKAAVKKAPARGAVPRAGVTRTVGTKSAAAKTAGSRAPAKAPARAPARSTAARSAPAKKAPAKKAAARKTSTRG
jgi:ribosome-associated protein